MESPSLITTLAACAGPENGTGDKTRTIAEASESRCSRFNRCMCHTNQKGMQARRPAIVALSQKLTACTRVLHGCPRFRSLYSIPGLILSSILSLATAVVRASGASIAIEIGDGFLRG